MNTIEPLWLKRYEYYKGRQASGESLKELERNRAVRMMTTKGKELIINHPNGIVKFPNTIRE